MIRCKLKKSVGFHLRKESGGMIRYNSGDIMEVANVKELGGAKDKFEILDPISEESELQLGVSPVALRLDHRGGGRYNVVNTETDEPINEEYLTKKEAETMVGSAEPEAAEEKPAMRKRKVNNA